NVFRISHVFRIDGGLCVGEIAVRGQEIAAARAVGRDFRDGKGCVAMRGRRPMQHYVSSRGSREINRSAALGTVVDGRADIFQFRERLLVQLQGGSAVIAGQRLQNVKINRSSAR